MTDTGVFKRRPLAPGPWWPKPRPRPSRRSLGADQIEEFFSKVGEPDENGCMMWLGGRMTGLGYGAFYVRGERIGAHRLAWEIENRRPLPDELWALHKCDHPWCVNPQHIFLGTVQDNVDDMWAKGRARPARGEEKSLLKNKEVRQVFQLLADNKLTQQEIANKFGVSRGAIKDINVGKNWRHLQPEGWLPSDGVCARGERNGEAKLTEDEVLQIYKLVREGVWTLQEIADRFGVGKSQVFRIKHRESWKHLWKDEEDVF